MIKTTVWHAGAIWQHVECRFVTGCGDLVLNKTAERVDHWLEVSLADESSLVAGGSKSCGDAWSIIWQGNAIHPHTVGRDMLASDHGAAGRHAHHILGVSSCVIDA